MAKKEEIVADLKHLLETDQTRTKMGRIWEIYEEIVELQQGGVSMKNIETLLNARGFALKPGNLTSYLCQIRKKKGIEKIVARHEQKPKKQPVKTKPSIPEVSTVTKKSDATSLLTNKTNMATLDSVKDTFKSKPDFSQYDE